eukprot:UC1_evm1s2094
MMHRRNDNGSGGGSSSSNSNSTTLKAIACIFLCCVYGAVYYRELLGAERETSAADATGLSHHPQRVVVVMDPRVVSPVAVARSAAIWEAAKTRKVDGINAAAAAAAAAASENGSRSRASSTTTSSSTLLLEDKVDETDKLNEKDTNAAGMVGAGNAPDQPQVDVQLSSASPQRPLRPPPPPFLYPFTAFADWMPPSSNSGHQQQQQPRAPLKFEGAGCLKADRSALIPLSPLNLADPIVRRADMTPQQCANTCESVRTTHFLITGGTMCVCARDPSYFESDETFERCQLPCGGAQHVKCGGKSWWSSAFHVTTPLRETITVYVAPAKRTSSLFMTSRLDKYRSGQYRYVTKVLNAVLQRNEQDWRKFVCDSDPGKKIFVQIQGATEFVLTHFPASSIFVLTADEGGVWGLTTPNGRAHGPHGKGKPFATILGSGNSVDSDSTRRIDGASSSSSSLVQPAPPPVPPPPPPHIGLPDSVLPIFRQYYDARQVAAFGAGNVLTLPLGSRREYPDITPDQIVPAPRRKYIYSYMVALTDARREKVHKLIQEDTVIPKDRAFVHISKSWHATAHNDDYVSPEEYAKVMLDSVFSLCPKGHSVEQFRIYEAIEAGAIPVLELNGDYLKDHLPPEYFESPILFLDKWEDLMPTLRDLMRDEKRLRQRQLDLLDWYDRYMRWQVRRMEEVLEAKTNRARIMTGQGGIDDDFCA